MIMIDTQLGCELARAHQNWKTAGTILEGNLDDQAVRDFWRKQKRQRRAVFIKLAEKLAEKLIEEKYHGMEGP